MYARTLCYFFFARTIFGLRARWYIYYPRVYCHDLKNRSQQIATSLDQGGFVGWHRRWHLMTTVKFGVFAGEIWPQFPWKSRLCNFCYAYITGISIQPFEDLRRRKFDSVAACRTYFFSQKITLSTSVR